VTFSWLTFARRAALAWSLLLTAGVVVTAPVVDNHAEAKRKRKKKRKARGGAEITRRAIDKGSLAPKEDFGLDEEISRTDDLKESLEKVGPALETSDIGRTRTMEDVLREKIAEEIRLVKELLEIQTDCQDGAAARFRLADLYWELGQREFFDSQDFGKSDNMRKKHEQRMTQLQRRTIDNYQRIIDECVDYADYPKVLFFQGSAYMRLQQPEDAASYFHRIIKEYPDSKWVGSAWFMVGEYYFNVKNEARKALKAYKRAEDYSSSQTYGYAVYKQGWCYVNMADWDLALERFRTVVRVSDDARLNMDQRGRVSLRKEGLKDYVRAYSHVGDVRKAFNTFIRVGGKRDVEWMMESLGKWYIANDAHTNIVLVYKDLIKGFPKSTRIPLFQGRIVKAVSILDKKAVVQQSKLLTEYFARTRKRLMTGEFDKNVEKRKAVRRDLAEAEEIAENTLRGLAMDFHKEAKKLRGTARDRWYKIAHDLYKHYLTVFPEPRPDADVNYVFFMRFYYAEVLFKLERFEAAATNYDIVVDMDPHPKKKKQREIVMAAAENAVHAYRELVEDLDRKNPPKISGTAPKPIPEIKGKLIHSCQRYIDYVGKTGDKIVEIRYLVAYIYYTYNHFDKAAPAFDDIVDNHPGHDRACFAANLTLDIYKGADNFKALMETARSYKKNNALACGENDRARFADIEEKSSFKLIKMDLEDKKKNLAAAKAYLQFYKRFPNSEFADDAVYNAAYNYDVAQRLDKANEVREFLVNKMPNADKGLVQETLFNIAASYERIVDFDKAAHYLELYAQKYPDDAKSKDAMYNAGLYRATLHDFEGSRRNREQFLRKYPRDKDADQVAYSICEAAEKEAAVKKQSSAWEAVNDCYYRYVRNYDGANDDNVCHAQFRRGEIMRTKTKHARGYAEQVRYLTKTWPRWKKRNRLEDLPKCAAAIAETEFRELQSDFKKYKDMLISEINPATEKGQKRFNASVKAKVGARDKLIEKYKRVAEYGQVVTAAEWSLAALFSIGEAYRDSVEKLLAAPIPSRVQGYTLTEEDKNDLRQRLKDMTPAIEQQAIEAYQICVSKGNELGVYTRWSLRAAQRLQEMRPQEFPPSEIRIAEVELSDRLTVEQNGLVVPDGASWTSLDVQVATDGVRPGKNGSGKATRKATRGSRAEPAPGDPRRTRKRRGAK
jgi:tetratricopeptide (TPR) repeat protein